MAVRPGAAPAAPVTVVTDAGSVQRPTARPAAPKAVVDRAGNLLVVYEHPLRFDGVNTETELRSQRWVQRAGTWTGATLGGPPTVSKRPVLAGTSDTGGALAAWLGLDAANKPVVNVRRFD